MTPRRQSRAGGTDRSFIVPVFLPHAGCPHRCVFCNQHTLARPTGGHPPDPDWRAAAIDFLRFRRNRPCEIAFFGGTFLGLPAARVRELLAGAADLVRREHLDGIRFSTRPDSVSGETLSIMADYPVVTVELGAQSMSDAVLRESGRGHTAQDTVTAVARLREHGCRVGLQLMIGLPGEDAAGLAETVRRVAELAPDFVRIYPTLVLAGSELEHRYHAGRYRPLSLDRAVALTAGVYRFFRARGIAVVRTGLQATPDLTPGASVVAGPHHPAFGELVQSACFREALVTVLRREPLPGPAVMLRVHPCDVSRVRGQRNATVALLKREYGWKQVGVEPDECVAEGGVALPDGRLVRVYDAPDADPDALRLTDLS